MSYNNRKDNTTLKQAHQNKREYSKCLYLYARIIVWTLHILILLYIEYKPET